MDGLLLKMLENSLFTSAAVILLALFSLMLRKKTPPKLRYACWLVIAVCFLIPFRPSLFTVTIPEDNLASGYVNTLIRQDNNTADAGGQADTDSQALDKNAGILMGNSEAYNRNIQMWFKTAFDTSTGQITWQYLLTSTVIPLVWILGLLISLTVYVVGNLRFIRKIRQTSTPVTDSALNDLLDDICGEIGLKRHLGLAISPIIGTPIVAGFFRPVIYLPCDPVDYRKLRFMLMHEAIHIKKGHMWGKLLSLSTMVVHWFNPAVYIMNRCIVAESELACDAAVLRYAGEDHRMEYGETVFQTAKRSWQSAPILVSAFSDSGKSLKRRLTAIIERDTTRRWVAICCAVVMVTGLMAAGLVGCEQLTSDEGVFVPIPQQEIDLTPTNELVIYIPTYNFLQDDMLPAIRAYEQKYPDVKVTLEFISESDYSGTAYSQRVNTELIAGTGPDIIVAYSGFFHDMYKTMDTGAFLNLSSIMDNDEDFHMEDYYQSVLDAGLYKGGRYVVPYCFQVPLVAALTDELEAVGFDLSKSSVNTVSFFNELARCLPKIQENQYSKSPISDKPYILNAYYYAGIELIDYENRKVLPDEASLKAFCEAYKPYAKIDHPTGESFTMQNNCTYNELKTGGSLFALSQFTTTMSEIMREATAYGDSAVLSAVPSMDGGLNAFAFSSLAIRSTSPNQLNAWNFIKIMLSEEMQQRNMWGPASNYCPVNRNSLRNIVEYYNNAIMVDPDHEISDRSLTSEELQLYYDLLDNITGCSLLNNIVYGYCYGIMQPYFLDEKSYDECVKELKRTLKLYLDE